MPDTFNGRVFFYCTPTGPPENSAYQHETVCLAEGLQALGVEVFSNINYWQRSPDPDSYLLQVNPKVTPDDCSIVVLSPSWTYYQGEFPKNLFHVRRNYVTVLLDSSDGIRTDAWNPECRQFDFILRTHFNRFSTYPANFRPWVFGLSNRIIQAVERAVHPPHKRGKNIVCNFRVTHSIRETVVKEFLPLLKGTLCLDDTTEEMNDLSALPVDYLYWVQTGRRHHPAYYERLSRSLACACFGGYMIGRWPADPALRWEHSLAKRVFNRCLSILDPRPKRVVQWDSWRFWEALVSGCVAVHVDFEKYGVQLPVMPHNWHDYIGIDLGQMQRDAARITDNIEELAHIGERGRHWALEHYSPEPTAKRFLDLIRQRAGTS